MVVKPRADQVLCYIIFTEQFYKMGFVCAKLTTSICRPK